MDCSFPALAPSRCCASLTDGRATPPSFLIASSVIPHRASQTTRASPAASPPAPSPVSFSHLLLPCGQCCRWTRSSPSLQSRAIYGSRRSRDSPAGWIRVRCCSRLRWRNSHLWPDMGAAGEANWRQGHCCEFVCPSKITNLPGKVMRGDGWEAVGRSCRC